MAAGLHEDTSNSQSFVKILYSSLLRDLYVRFRVTKTVSINITFTDKTLCGSVNTQGNDVWKIPAACILIVQNSRGRQQISPKRRLLYANPQAVNQNTLFFVRKVTAPPTLHECDQQNACILTSSTEPPKTKFVLMNDLITVKYK